MSTNRILDAKIPVGPPGRQVGQAQDGQPAGGPGRQPAQAHHHRRGHGPGRRRRRRDPGRAGLQRPELLHPGHAPARPLGGGPGRHQRRQELPERRRQHLPPVLRHHQGRRLPLPRGQHLPPGPALDGHHRPVRGHGRALRPRVRRHPGQPLLRRRAGQPHLLRAGPDGPAAAAGRLQRPEPADRGGHREDVPAPRDAGPGGRRRPRPRHRDPRPDHGRDHRATPPTRWCWPPAATAPCSTCPPTPSTATRRPSGGPTGAAPCSPTRATRRSTRPACPTWATTSRS